MTYTAPRNEFLSRLLSASLWVSGAKFISLFAVLGTNMLLARMLTQEEFGTFFVFLSGILITGTIARFGLKQTVVKVISEAVSTNDLGRAKSAVNYIFVIVSAGGILLALLAFFFMNTLSSDSYFNLPLLAPLNSLFAISILFQALLTPVASALKGFRVYSISSLLDDINPAIPSLGLFLIVFICYLLKVNMSLKEVLIAHASLFLFSLLIGIFFLFHKVRDLPTSDSLGITELLSLSMPVYLVNLSTILVSELSTWLAAYFSSAEEVAVYGAALKLAKLVLIPMVIVNLAIAPFISELYSTDKIKKLQAVLRGMTTLAAYPAAIVLIIFIINGGDVLAIVYGEVYESGSTFLKIFSCGLMFVVWSGPSITTLIVMGGHTISMYISICAACIMILLGVSLGATAGLNGLAIAVVCSMIFQNLAAWYFVRIRSGIMTNASWNIKESIISAKKDTSM